MLSVRLIAMENNLTPPISLKDDLMTIGGTGYKSLKKQLRFLLMLNRGRFTFSSGDIKVHVPARGLTGAPPRREIEGDLEASEDYIHDSPFYEIADYHDDGLTEVSSSFSKTNGTGPGVHYYWEFKNEESFPPSGRTAKMKLHLLVLRKPDYEISLPYFSPVYTAIRQRFFEKFYHSGLVATNYIPNKNKLIFGDQPLYMGQTLLMLSGEYKIWDRRRRPDKKAEVVNVIQEILNTIERHLEKPSNSGYIMRDSVSGKDYPLLSGEFDEVYSDFQGGRDNEISIDNYIGLMIGLLMVHSILENTSATAIAEQASGILGRFFNYLKARKFWVETPEGVRVSRGPDARGFVTLLHGIYLKATGNDVFDDLEVEFPDNNPIPGNQQVRWVGTVWDSGGLLSDIFKQLGQTFNSFSVHMALALLWSGEVWSQQQIEIASKQSHLLSIVLYAFYHNTAPMTVTWSSVKNFLQSCPSSGPSNKRNIWNQDNMWVRGGPGESSSDDEILYNGLDYMVVHNFAQLVYDTSL